MREYCSLITSWRSSSSVASAGMATMLGRGVITSRTTLSPNSTTDWISLRSSSSIRPSSVPGVDQRFDVLRRSRRLLGAARFSSAISISEWKKRRRPRSPASWQAPARAAAGISGTSHLPLDAPVEQSAEWRSPATSISSTDDEAGFQKHQPGQRARSGTCGQHQHPQYGQRRVLDQRETKARPVRFRARSCLRACS